MIWGKMTTMYNQLTMGYSENSDISRADHKSRGFDDKRLIAYAESHDENQAQALVENALHAIQQLLK